MDYKKMIMIVDDDIDDRDFFSEAVAELAIPTDCLTSFNGENALILLRNGGDRLPDCIFLDLNMPKMDGRIFLVELKKDEKLKNIPVVMYSTSSHQKDIDETRALGAIFFVTKPTEFKKLLQTISFVMNSDWKFHDNEIIIH